MTRREHLALWTATLIAAATRVWGLARSPWDWDEMLFSLALRHYDVALRGLGLAIGALSLSRQSPRS